MIAVKQTRLEGSVAMRPFALVGAVSLALVGLGSVVPLKAADLDFPPAPTYAEPDAQFEFGTGWYLRGDAGWSDTTREQLLADLPALSSSTDWTGDVGAGYRWNNYFRTDLTVGFDGLQQKSQNIDSNRICVYTLSGLTAQDESQTKLGYAWTSNLGTCNGHNRGSLLKTDVLVNGYFDLGTWYGITPYVGAGVGAARIDTWNTKSYTKTSDGTTYNPDLTQLGGYPLVWLGDNGNITQPIVPTTGQPVTFSKQDWSKQVHSTRYNLAWSVMGGVSYALDDHLSLDLGYRYLNLGSYRDASGASHTIDAQQVRIGARYAID